MISQQYSSYFYSTLHQWKHIFYQESCSKKFIRQVNILQKIISCSPQCLIKRLDLPDFTKSCDETVEKVVQENCNIQLSLLYFSHKKASVSPSFFIQFDCPPKKWIHIKIYTLEGSQSTAVVQLTCSEPWHLHNNFFFMNKLSMQHCI